MTTFGKLAEFKPGTEEFSAYLERVDLFFLSNDVAAEKKVPIFLNCIGSTTYSLLRGLVAPEKPADLSLADLTAKLKAHFEPKHIVIAERFQFYKRGQNHGESVAEYLAELRRLAARCAFGNYLEEALRDRLVCGCAASPCPYCACTEKDGSIRTCGDFKVTINPALRIDQYPLNISSEKNAASM